MLKKYAQVILPLALQKRLTYSIPLEWDDFLQVGHRVEVQLGNKRRYAGIVVGLLEEYQGLRQPKPLLDILDEEAIIHPWQIELWQWMSEYYLCTEGEVMNAALPAGLKLSSESVVILHQQTELDEWKMNDGEMHVMTALIHQPELTIGQIEELVPQGKAYRVIKSLLEKEIILIKERLKESIAPKTIDYVEMSAPLQSDEGFLSALDQLSRAPKQSKAMLALYELQKAGLVTKKALMQKSGTSSGIIKSLLDKNLINIFQKYAHEVIEDSTNNEFGLSKDQEDVFEKIEDQFTTYNTQLLRGVTGSGKTHIYIELIKKAIADGDGQALFLLPEIALTTQLVQRMKNTFGDQCVAYHSRMGDRERTAIWHVVKKGHPIVIGARSALMLPFQNLKMIVVDEEHDMSYKQMDPAPRYSARDTAVMLSHKYKIPCLLGSATPSLETLHNVKAKRFGFSELTKQFHGSSMAKIEIIDLRKSYKMGEMVDFFSQSCLDQIKETVENGKQVLVFQNRRGHSHIMQCGTCGWSAGCRQCDVSLTFHKVFKDLRCHYCGMREEVPRACPDCGGTELMFKGLGTEKIEQDLSIHFPDFRIARMDLDTARGNKSRSQLIEKMEDRLLDILIGTQMITKGLDFENIGLVVVPQADQLLFYPDFRTNERAYQMLLQVSGRAGRKKEQGKVLLQSFQPEHRVLQTLISGEVKDFLGGESEERKNNGYPPFYRLIKIEVKHKKPKVAAQAAAELVNRLRVHWKNRVIGPAEPPIARIRNLFTKQVWIKYEKRADITTALKKNIKESIQETNKLKGLSNVRFNVNVDPQ